MRSEYVDLEAIFAKEENEHSWEQIDKGLKKFHTAVRATLTQDEHFVDIMKKQWCINGFVRSVSTERTRLSATTLDVLASVTRLGSSFAPLLPAYLPPILKLLCRTNKLYISRSSATILAIVKNTKLSEILKYIVTEWKAEGGKSTSFRISVTEIVMVMVTLLDLERFLPELEFIIKVGATDKEPRVRQGIKSIYDIFQQSYPTRVEQFTAPLSPTARKYLHIGSSLASSSTVSSALPTRTTIKKPKIAPIDLAPKTATLSQSTTTLSAASIRKQLSTNSLSKSTSALPKSNSLSKSVGAGFTTTGTSGTNSLSNSLSRSTTSSRSDLKSSTSSSSRTVTHDIPPVPTHPLPPSRAPLHSTLPPPALTTSTPGAFRPQSIAGPSASRALPPPAALRFASSSLHQNAVKPVLLRKASRVVPNSLAERPSLMASRAAVGGMGIGTGNGNGNGAVASSGPFRPQRIAGAVRVLPNAVTSSSLNSYPTGTALKSQKTLNSAKSIIAQSRKPFVAATQSQPLETLEVPKEEVMLEESWDGDEGNGILSETSQSPLKNEMEKLDLADSRMSSVKEHGTPTSSTEDGSFFRDVARIAVGTPLPPSLTTSPTNLIATIAPVKKEFDMNDLFGLSFSPIKPSAMMDSTIAASIALPDTPTPTKGLNTNVYENDYLFSPIKPEAKAVKVESPLDSKWMLDLKTLLPESFTTVSPFGTPNGLHGTGSIVKLPSKIEVNQEKVELVAPVIPISKAEEEEIGESRAIVGPAFENSEATVTPALAEGSIPDSIQKSAVFLRDESDDAQFAEDSVIEDSYFLPLNNSTTLDDSLLWNQQQDQLDDSFLDRSFRPSQALPILTSSGLRSTFRREGSTSSIDSGDTLVLSREEREGGMTGSISGNETEMNDVIFGAVVIEQQSMKKVDSEVYKRERDILGDLRN